MESRSRDELQTDADELRTEVRPNRLERRDFVIAAAIVAGSALFHLLYVNHGVRNWIDLGVAASDAVRIMDGDHWGSDFLAPYGPGRYYVTAIWFSVFGTSLFSLNMLYLCLMSVVDLLAWFAARRFLPRHMALGVVILATIAHGPVHKVWIGLFAVLFFLAAIRAFDRRTYGAGFVLGLTGALTGLFRNDVGVCAAILGILILGTCALRPATKGEPKRARSLTVGFVMGGLSVAAPMVILICACGDPAWIVESILARISVFDSVRVADPGLGELFGSGGAEGLLQGTMVVLLLAAPFAVAIFGLLGLFAGSRRSRAGLYLVLGLLGVFLLNQWRLIPRFVRLMQAGPILYLCVVLLFFEARRILARASSARALRAACVAPLTATLLLTGAMGWYLWEYTGEQSQDSIAVLRFDEHYMDTPRARCWAKIKRGGDMDRVVGVVERFTKKGEAIFAGPGCPIVYFLADRPNPTPFADPYLYFLNPDAETRIITALEERNVRVVVDQPRPIGGLSLADAAPRLYNYIQTRFRRCEAVGRYVVLRR